MYGRVKDIVYTLSTRRKNFSQVYDVIVIFPIDYCNSGVHI